MSRQARQLPINSNCPKRCPSQLMATSSPPTKAKAVNGKKSLPTKMRLGVIPAGSIPRRIGQKRAYTDYGIKPLQMDLGSDDKSSKSCLQGVAER